MRAGPCVLCWPFFGRIANLGDIQVLKSLLAYLAIYLRYVSEDGLSLCGFYETCVGVGGCIYIWRGFWVQVVGGFYRALPTGLEIAVEIGIGCLILSSICTYFGRLESRRWSNSTSPIFNHPVTSELPVREGFTT